MTFGTHCYAVFDTCRSRHGSSNSRLSIPSSSKHLGEFLGMDWLPFHTGIFRSGTPFDQVTKELKTHIRIACALICTNFLQPSFLGIQVMHLHSS